MAPTSEVLLSAATAVSPPSPACPRPCSASRSPVLAAYCSPSKQNEILELLRDLDTLQKQYDEGLCEIHEVRTTLSVERKKLEAVETTCLDLEREKQRLLKAQLATYERASKELDYASKYENSLQLIKAAHENSNLNNTEHENTIMVLRQRHEAELEDLYKQTMYTSRVPIKREVLLYGPFKQNWHKVLKQEVASNEHEVLTLQRKLADSLTPDVLRVKLQEAEKEIHNSYQDEIEGLKRKLTAEEIKNQNLQSQLKDAQLALMVSNVNHDDQLRELSANRQADIFKQKIMKLRKDNEVLRHHLQQNLQK